MAHAHCRSVGRDILNRLPLVIADECVEVVESSGFRFWDMNLVGLVLELVAGVLDLQKNG